MPRIRIFLTRCLCSIYLELAEQYGLMDATSNVSKRNVLADHLREVVDVLEQKVCDLSVFCIPLTNLILITG